MITPEERERIRDEAREVAAGLRAPPPGLFTKIAAMMSDEINELAREE